MVGADRFWSVVVPELARLGANPCVSADKIVSYWRPAG